MDALLASETVSGQINALDIEALDHTFIPASRQLVAWEYATVALSHAFSRILFRSDRLGKMKLGASQSLRKKSGYLPSLDGWRALAILGVLMTHDYPSRSGWFGNLQGFGGYGVYLFFAISGILICTRILEEEAAVGRFRLGSFYIRRLFRIQPAAVTYLAVIGLLTIAGCIHERWHFWDGALFLYANYL